MKFLPLGDNPHEPSPWISVYRPPRPVTKVISKGDIKDIADYFEHPGLLELYNKLFSETEMESEATESQQQDTMPKTVKNVKKEKNTKDASGSKLKGKKRKQEVEEDLSEHSDSSCGTESESPKRQKTRENRKTSEERLKQQRDEVKIKDLKKQLEEKLKKH